MSEREAIIQILDDAFSDELCQRALDAVAQKRWYFGNSSVGAAEPAFWKMDFERDATIDALWSAIRERCEALAAVPLRVLRQYANGHTYGLGGRPHVDDSRPGHYTLLYYPMAAWEPAWGGETVFHRSNGEIALAVLPKPNRAVLFDARIPHEGRAPSRDYGGLRVTLAFKLGPAGAAT
ncbi:MAG TPA: 2OG-Fe(II) oxygenase [Polyangiaceae bacterium]